MEKIIKNNSVDYGLEIASESKLQEWGYFQYVLGGEILSAFKTEWSVNDSAYRLLMGKDSDGNAIVEFRIGDSKFPIDPDQEFNIKDAYKLIHAISVELVKQEDTVFRELKAYLLSIGILNSIINKYKFRSKEMNMFLRKVIPDFYIIEDLLQKIPNGRINESIGIITNDITVKLLNICLIELGYRNEIEIEVKEVYKNEDKLEDLLVEIKNITLL